MTVPHTREDFKIGPVVIGKERRGSRNERCLSMPREGAIIFRDIVGKLDVLRVECDKCNRKGQYCVDRRWCKPAG
jgi:hypothetical protein